MMIIAAAAILCAAGIGAYIFYPGFHKAKVTKSTTGETAARSLIFAWSTQAPNCC